MMRNRRIILSIMLVQILSNLWADNIDDKTGVMGKIQLGGILNYGNTNTRNISTNFEVNHSSIKWSNDLNIAYDFSQDDKETIGSRLVAALVSKYNLNNTSYLFIKGETIIDKFGTFDRIFRESVGYGHNLYKTESTNLSLYLGPGASQSRISGKNTYIHQFVGQVGGDFCHKFTDSLSYSQSIVSYIGQKNTNIQWKNSIETQISKSLALDISVCLDYNSYIPQESNNKKHLDTITKMSVTYKFG